MNSIQLECEITGHENKETLFFVHGAGGNAGQFKQQHRFFSDHYKVVSVSLRGHGESPSPSPNTTDQYSLTLLATDIIHLIEDLKLDRIHYVGNSAGGVLGYIVVNRIPSRFLSLTTFGTTSQMNIPRFLAPVVRGIDTFMLRFFTNWYLKFVASHAGLNEESKDISYQMLLKASQAIPHMRYHLVKYDFTWMIEQSPIPYTLIKCEFDRDINRALNTTLSAVAKNEKAKVVDLKGVGHMANLDNPEIFNKCLTGILKSLIIKNRR
ncbi:alpha/beta fold hydrolase [Pararhodonellum marinum]|uniref:alpha/beta fold hydrolase n=1 Tax=Pararhodonellum marinum TaxID=2755358 RepID=UPI00188ED093|nr:alpha/beta hydrolase [Pararhodonellum marinum]